MNSRDDRSAGRTAERVRTAAIVLLIALVVLSPWPFGSASPSGQLAIATVLVLLTALWTAHAILTQRLSYRSDSVSICLLGLVIITAIQLVPLPESVARQLSPVAVEWRHALVPELPELLPGESEASIPPRSSWMRLSQAPAATEDLLVQFLGLFLIYTIARNFAVDSRALERLAWIGFATGVALALVAVAQYLSGARERIYWRFDTGAPVFGPFANKNHFPFQLNLFIGLGVGLFLRVARREGMQTPAGVGLLGGLGLMVAAVGFSQSRGGAIGLVAAGFIGWLAARSARKEGASSDHRTSLILLGGIGLVVVGLTAWLGWGEVLDRLSTLWQGSADNRTHVWRRAWPLAESFPLVGVGGGAYTVAERATRTVYEGSFISVSAHNEYLEALIEGGVIRCALTLTLAVVAIRSAMGRYQRTRDPLVLGCVIGLGAVAVQSIGDFGIHVPSVAIATAVVAAYAVPPGAERKVRIDAPVVPEPASPRRVSRALNLAGPAAYTTAGLLVFAALVVVLGTWRVWRVDRLRVAAAVVANTPDATRFLEAAAQVRPDDPDVWEELATAHLLSAAGDGRTALVAVVSFAAVAYPPDVLPESDPEGHVTAALRAARMSRDLQPLIAGPHLQLGAYTGRFARSEPAQVYFDRAKRIGVTEPDVWYVAGKAAADRGDWGAALADWHEALARSPVRLAAIARRAAGHVAPERFREQALPDDPAVWFAVIPQLFGDNAAERVKWLRAIDERCSRREPETTFGFAAWASALDELDDASGAIRVGQRAISRFPDDEELHNRLAARLETEDRYEEAQSVLEWLIQHQPEQSNYRTRLAAVRHALDLKAQLNRR